MNFALIARHAAMKVRVKCGSGLPTIALQISPDSSLNFLKRHVVDRRLARETCELSLNGKEALDENSTFVELGVVSGDVLYVLHCEDCHTGREGEREGGRGRGRGAQCSVMPVDTGCALHSSKEQSTTPTVCHGYTAQQLATGSAEKQPAVDKLAQNLRSRSDASACSHKTPEMICSMSTNTPEILAPPETVSDRSSQVSMCFSRFAELCHGGAGRELGRDGGDSYLTLTPANMLCIALNRLMLDTGYYLREGCVQLDASSAKWSYGSTVHDGVKVHMACVKMGPLLTVHAMATTTLEGSSACVSATHSLPLSSYVSRRGHTGGCVLLRPVELAQVFKDAIAHKLLVDIRKVLGLPEVGTFSSLFPELKLSILWLLDIRSLMATSSVSKELHMLCQDPYLWKHLLLRDFGRVALKPKGGSSWKQMYIQRYKIEQEMRQRRRVRLFPGDCWPLVPLLPPQPPLHAGPHCPGIIGGDYDLLPHPLAPRVRPHMPIDDHDHATLPRPAPRRLGSRLPRQLSGFRFI